jgi:hypothetical protein
MKVIEKIPTWAMSAIINDDRTGLEDSEIDMIEKWFESTGYDYVCAPKGESYFSSYPAFGLASDVYDCECIKL